MPPAKSTLSETARPHRLHPGSAPQEPDEALHRAATAELSSRHLGRMTRPELARVVRCSPMPAAQARLDYLDRGTLERLAHLACLACRNRR